jgi:hypothetical protein
MRLCLKLSLIIIIFPTTAATAWGNDIEMRDIELALRSKQCSHKFASVHEVGYGDWCGYGVGGEGYGACLQRVNAANARIREYNNMMDKCRANEFSMFQKDSLTNFAPVVNSQRSSRLRQSDVGRESENSKELSSAIESAKAKAEAAGQRAERSHQETIRNQAIAAEKQRLAKIAAAEGQCKEALIGCYDTCYKLREEFNTGPALKACNNACYLSESGAICYSRARGDAE